MPAQMEISQANANTSNKHNKPSWLPLSASAENEAHFQRVTRRACEYVQSSFRGSVSDEEATLTYHLRPAMWSWLSFAKRRCQFERCLEPNRPPSANGT